MSSRGDSGQPTLSSITKTQDGCSSGGKTQGRLHTPHREGHLPPGTQLEGSVLKGGSCVGPKEAARFALRTSCIRKVKLPSPPEPKPNESLK